MNIIVEFQYFDGCPNSHKLRQNLHEAIELAAMEIDVQEILVDSALQAREIRFRGSPTLLINGIDIAGMPLPDEGIWGCRVYTDGIPSAEKIIKALRSATFLNDA